MRKGIDPAISIFAEYAFRRAARAKLHPSIGSAPLHPGAESLSKPLNRDVFKPRREI
jgi:hypothetical protein